MSSKVKNNLIQLAKVERYITQFQKLSAIHERALAEHNDRLDYTWKEGYKMGVRDGNSTQKSNAEANNQIKKNLNNQIIDLQNKSARLEYQVSNFQSQLSTNPEPVIAEIGSTLTNGFIVKSWRDSKKWISNWCFGLIVFFAATPIPPEVLAVLPENVRYYLIALTALCGFIGRYINQTKPVSLPPINNGDADV